jgi:hypothetical protein
MANETNSSILPPEDYPKSDAARAASKGIAGAIPLVGSVISEVIEHFAPDPAAKDRIRWELEVTNQLNRLTAASGRTQISRDSFAWKLALFANELDTNANGEVAIDDSAIGTHFPDVSNVDLEDALSDLSDADWIDCWLDANSRTGVGGFHTKALLFAHTDPVVWHTSPSVDAMSAAKFILEQESEEAVSATMIEEKMGWSARRLYPALAFLKEEVFPSDSVESYYHPKYPFTWLYLNGKSRRALRRFIDE